MRGLLVTLTLIFQLADLSNGQVLSPAQRTLTGGPQTRASSPQNPVRPGDEDVVRITTNLVQVDPVITDSKGKPVTDLRPDEVQIMEDGKPQQITNFSYIALDAPVVTKSVKPDKNALPTPPVRLRPDQVHRTIALVVDDLGLSFESTYYVRQALKKFIDQQMQPQDLVAIIRTSGGIGALQQFTTDKRQLYAALEKVRWRPLGRGGIGAFAPINSDQSSIFRNSSSGEGDVPQIDIDQFRADVFTVGTLGAINYVVRGLRELPGRKSLILLSDGFSTFSRSDPTGSVSVLAALQGVTEQANRASVVISTIDPRGLPTLGLSAADNTAGMDMAQVQQALNNRSSDFFNSQGGPNSLAQDTGGLSIRNTNDLSGGLRRIIEDQGGYYLIGYRPDDSTFDSLSGKRKFHKLSLTVTRPGKFNVRMRRGFYGITEDEAKPSFRGMDPMVAALISPFGAADIHVRLTSLFARDPKLGSIMRSMLHVDASDLTFKEEADGWHSAAFGIIAYTFGDNGIVVDQMGRKHSFRVKGKTYEQILNHGFTYNITVPVKKPGAYLLRTAIKDASSARIGSASQFIEVPDLKKKRLALSGIMVNGLSQQAYDQGDRKLTAPQDNSDDSASAPDPKAHPAVRQFKRGLVMLYGYYIYNARLDKTTQKPQLLTRVRVFRNGEEIFTGKDRAFDASNQTDLKQLAETGAVQLGSEMKPGEYVLQVIVTDLQVSGHYRLASQWIDFDIVD